MGRKPSETITPNQERVYLFVKTQAKRVTLQQVADFMEWSSLSTAAGVVNALIRRGLLVRSRRTKALRAVEAKVTA